MYHFLFWETE